MGRLADGRTVFVPRTAPGDLVILSGLRTHARFARARLGELVEPGPGRTTPRCRHYFGDQCGGCQLQHLDYRVQLEIKRGILEDALHRIGRLDVTVPPLIAADDPWHYRSRISLAMGPGRRRRGVPSAGPSGRCLRDGRVCYRRTRTCCSSWTPCARGCITCRLTRSSWCSASIGTAGCMPWSGPAEIGRGAADRVLPRRRVRRGVPVTIWWQPAQGALRVVAGTARGVPRHGVRAGAPCARPTGSAGKASTALVRVAGRHPGISTPASARPPTASPRWVRRSRASSWTAARSRPPRAADEHRPRAGSRPSVRDRPRS